MVVHDEAHGGDEHGHGHGDEREYHDGHPLIMSSPRRRSPVGASGLKG
jgi:hypothetical protein